LRSSSRPEAKPHISPSSRPKAAHFATAVEGPPHFIFAVVCSSEGAWGFSPTNALWKQRAFSTGPFPHSPESSFWRSQNLRIGPCPVRHPDRSVAEWRAPPHFALSFRLSFRSAAEESASAHYVVILSAVWRARAKRSRRTCGCLFALVIPTGGEAHISRHPDRRRRTLPPQWRDPRTSFFAVVCSSEGAWASAPRTTPYGSKGL